MSAWIVSKTHIDALVQAGVEAEMVRPEGADEFGRMLWRENHASIAYRYGHRIEDGEYEGWTESLEAVEAYEYAPLDGKPGITRAVPGVVFKTAACYDYQTCEHPGYHTSKAARFIGMLTELCGGERNYDTPVWNAAPWGTDDRDTFVRFAHEDAR